MALLSLRPLEPELRPPELHRVGHVLAPGTAALQIKAVTAVLTAMLVESNAQRLRRGCPVLRQRLHRVLRRLFRSGRCGEQLWLRSRLVLP